MSTNMLTWYTTEEWIALQFDGKRLEELTETETNIANKLIEEGCLTTRLTTLNDGEYKITVNILVYNSKPQRDDK